MYILQAIDLLKRLPLCLYANMDDDILDSRSNRADEFVVTFVNSESAFTNWSAHRIAIWGKRFATVEHAYQYRKFIEIDPLWAAKIQHARSPWLAKQLAHERPIVREKWDKKREKVMRDLIRAKVYQHEDVRHALRKTGVRAIVENGADGDDFWGMGRNNTGKNTLGRIWLGMRDEIGQSDQEFMTLGDLK